MAETGTRAGMLGLEVSRGRVVREWIDVNGHMNVAYYVLAFDQGVDALWARFGITDEHIRSNLSSTFAVEAHVMYLRELHENDPFVVTAQIIAFDEKRIHQFQRMYNAEDGGLAATAEWMNLHVDLATRRVAPWPGHVLAGIAAIARRQRGWPPPAEAGHRMSIAKPLFAAGED